MTLDRIGAWLLTGVSCFVSAHALALLPAHSIDVATLAIPAASYRGELVIPRQFDVVIAAESPGESGEADMDSLLEELFDRAGHAHQIEVRRPWERDPAIFTELSPVTVDETPVRLPPDQRLE